MTARGIPLSRVEWSACYRIIPSRFPARQLFERVADAGDLDAVFAIEALTNDRVRDETGAIRIVPDEERVSGPGMGYVMAAFTHIAPAGGRFTDGTFGAYYAAHDLDTAIDETIHHREAFLRATREAPIELEMRVLRAHLTGELHDLRGLRSTLPDVYDPSGYGASQALARRLRAEGSEGIAYESVRRPGGECAAAFLPRLLSRCQQTHHLAYVWDGRRITTVYQKKVLR